MAVRIDQGFVTNASKHTPGHGTIAGFLGATNSDTQIQEVQGDVSGERQRGSVTAVIAQVCKTHKDAQYGWNSNTQVR